MFTSFIIGFILCSIAFLIGIKFGRHEENREWLGMNMQQVEVLAQQEATIREMGELIDSQAATIKGYSDMGPAEHIRVANNLLKFERRIMDACTYNQELRAARSMASKVMRQHLEPEV